MLDRWSYRYERDKPQVVHVIFIRAIVDESVLLVGDDLKFVS